MGLIYHHSEEAKMKISQSLRGRLFSEEYKRNLSLSHRGKHHSEQNKNKISKALIGITRSIETRQKISLSLVGRTLTEEHRKQLSLNHADMKGHKHPMYGKHHSQEAKDKLAQAMAGRHLSEAVKAKIREAVIGENHPNWQGGISFEPYGPEFNNDLKDHIRAKYDYTCQLCGTRENGRRHDTHHIDYDKKHNTEDNFILLCGNCNLKVNNNREYWTAYFREKIDSL